MVPIIYWWCMCGILCDTYCCRVYTSNCTLRIVYSLFFSCNRTQCRYGERRSHQTCAHTAAAATSDNCVTFAASYRIAQKSLAATPRQSHRIMEGDKDTRMHCRVRPTRGWRRKAIRERITLDNEQEQQ